MFGAGFVQECSEVLSPFQMGGQELSGGVLCFDVALVLFLVYVVDNA